MGAQGRSGRLTFRSRIASLIGPLGPLGVQVCEALNAVAQYRFGLTEGEPH